MGKRKRGKKNNRNVLLRKVILSLVSWWDNRGINWLLSAAHRYTIVITIEYVNRRVKSEFNTIINRGRHR